jgi:hypothetical protein
MMSARAYNSWLHKKHTRLNESMYRGGLFYDSFDTSKQKKWDLIYSPIRPDDLCLTDYLKKAKNKKLKQMLETTIVQDAEEFIANIKCNNKTVGIVLSTNEEGSTELKIIGKEEFTDVETTAIQNEISELAMKYSVNRMKRKFSKK